MCNVYIRKEEEEIAPHPHGMFPSFTYDRLAKMQKKNFELKLGKFGLEKDRSLQYKFHSNFK